MSFLVANLDDIFQRHLRWLTNLPRVKPFYAVKCNNTAAVLRMMTALDMGFDCASKVLKKCFKDNLTLCCLSWKKIVTFSFVCSFETCFNLTQGEIQLALSFGVKPDEIIYAHTTKALSHIKYACAHGVDRMTFDNEDELLKISLCHPKAK